MANGELQTEHSPWAEPEAQRVGFALDTFAVRLIDHAVRLPTGPRFDPDTVPGAAPDPATAAKMPFMFM